MYNVCIQHYIHMYSALGWSVMNTEELLVLSMVDVMRSVPDSDAEKKTMLLSAETSTGLKLTGMPVMCSTCINTYMDELCYAVH